MYPAMDINDINRLAQSSPTLEGRGTTRPSSMLRGYMRGTQRHEGRQCRIGSGAMPQRHLAPAATEIRPLAPPARAADADASPPDKFLVPAIFVPSI